MWKWWEEEKGDSDEKWRFLEHKGPVFAPLYERMPKDVKFYYNGKMHFYAPTLRGYFSFALVCLSEN